MSEEEAIKWLEELLKDKEKYKKYHSWVGTDTFVAIDIILDLYNKQKEEIEEEKEKWKELFHEYNKLVGEVIDKEQDLKDSISKDKIRDKIKALEELRKTLATHEELDFQIDTLKELLEEN